MNKKKKILITGAAGLIGGHLRHHWGDRYQLRLADIRPVENLAPHEEFIDMDIAQYDPFVAACQDIDVVVHLAADPSPRAGFYPSLLELNIKGCYNAFAAAHRAHCQRVVFASSIHAILGYRDRGEVPSDAPVYPTNLYGASKCWGEALARVYSEAHNLSCICVRIGTAAWTQENGGDPQQLAAGISARDQAQLFACCIDAPEEVKFKIVHGVSKHTRSWMDLSVSQELGYEPQDGTAFL